jgi:hypothetical protein
MSDEERMEMSTVECQHLAPSWQGNEDVDAEVKVEEDHPWPTKDGPLPIFLKVLCFCIYYISLLF